MFRFGDQKDQPSAAPTLDMALASVPMASPTEKNSDLLKAAAVLMAAGKLIGQRLRPSAPVAQPDCTPCSASLHQFWLAIHRLGTGPALLTSSEN